MPTPPDSATAPPGEVRGRCLCGAVRYRVRGALRPVVYCHCRQCRRTSGHFTAATAAERADVELLAAGGLRWYRSSAYAERGFCGECGASVFWRHDEDTKIAIMAGTLEEPTGLAARAHIFVADAGDYYTLDDGLPQVADGDADLGISGGDPERAPA